MTKLSEIIADDSDERESLLSGRVYKHTLIFVVALLLLSAVLSSANVHIADEFSTDIFIIWLAVTFGNIESCLIGAVNFDSRRYLGLMLGIGMCTVLMVVSAAVSVATGGHWVAHRQLTAMGMTLLYALCSLAMILTYFVARARYRKNADD